MSRLPRILALSVAVVVVIAACDVAGGPPITGAVEAETSGPQSASAAAPASTTPDPTDVVPRSGEPWLAFQTSGTEGYGIYLMRPDGTGMHRPTPDIAGTQEHPDFSPDGERIAFSVSELDETEDLWVSDVDGSGTERIVDCQAPCQFADEPAWSPDGRTIAFTRAVEGAGGTVGTLETIDVATGAVAVVLTTRDRDLVFAPRWSPDGTRLAVEVARWSATTTDGDPTGGIIGLIDLRDATPKIRPLMDWERRGNNPDWSPIEDLIAFSAPDGDRDDLYTIGADGRDLRNLTATIDPGLRHAVQPTFTPDGRRLVFIREGDVMSTIALDGTGLRSAVTSGDMAGFHPRFRPTS